MSLNITIKTGECRFGGVADWPSYDEIVVKPLDDWRVEFMLAVHELIEAGLCKHRGITAKMVDAWDEASKDADAAGDSESAPYFMEHAFASRVEFMLAEELGVSYPDYVTAIAGTL